ncbi:MAG: DUF3784 domain-containing protein [Erysipelotrichaceae bacterium]|nr:DUF3784 domain-containing protein [Erysipelotrichaceae bacterium]
MKILISCFLFIIACTAFVLSVRSFFEKGFLLNNAYLYASQTEKETMNKKPYYRQSAVVFLMVSLIFLLNGLSVLLMIEDFSYLAMVMIPIVLVYVVVSSIGIERKK